MLAKPHKQGFANGISFWSAANTPLLSAKRGPVKAQTRLRTPHKNREIDRKRGRSKGPVRKTEAFIRDGECS
jgi:hypothetical protein